MSVSKRRRNKNRATQPNQERLPQQGSDSDQAEHLATRLTMPPEMTGLNPRQQSAFYARDQKEDRSELSGGRLKPRPWWMFLVAVSLSLAVIGFYARVYNPHQGGWTRLIDFGEQFAPDALPRLKKTRHYIVKNSGNDGQFYAQLAIDPSAQDPAFNQALDNPAYRSRRILVPALSFCLGWAKPKRVIQAYALSNLLFWFVLAGSLITLAQPWTARQIFGVAATLLSFGALTSMEHAMVDLPAAALIFLGLVLSSWGRYGAFAAAALTRETSVLAALAGLDLRRPFAERWKQNLGCLILAGLPLAIWIVYLNHRFSGLGSTAGVGNFGLPLQAMGERFFSALSYWIITGPDGRTQGAGPFGWLYLDEGLHEGLAVLSLFFQGLYIVLRRDWQSALWRTGFLFTILCAIFGSAVWGWTGAAARVLLPMTGVFYLRLAREENDRWFWWFALLGSLSLPFGVHELWTGDWPR